MRMLMRCRYSDFRIIVEVFDMLLWAIFIHQARYQATTALDWFLIAAFWRLYNPDNALFMMQRPAAALVPPVQRLASDEISLHLDHVSLTGSAMAASGVTLYSERGAQKGAIIFNLMDLEEDKVWYTENGNTVKRISNGEILLGDSLTLPILAPPVAAEDLRMPMLSPRAGTAEEAVEELTRLKLTDGIPLHKHDKATDRWQEHGRVIFDLGELPLLDEYYYLVLKTGPAPNGATRPLFKLCRLDNTTFLINHREYQAKNIKASPPQLQTTPRNFLPTSPRDIPTSPTPLAAAWSKASLSPPSSALSVATADDDETDDKQLQRFRERTGKVSESKQKERQERLARMMQQLAVSYESGSTPPATPEQQTIIATPAAPAPSPAPAVDSSVVPSSPSAGSSPSQQQQFMETLATSMSDRKAALRAQRKREMEAELERKYAATTSSPSKPPPAASPRTDSSAGSSASSSATSSTTDASSV